MSFDALQPADVDRSRVGGTTEIPEANRVTGCFPNAIERYDRIKIGGDPLSGAGAILCDSLTFEEIPDGTATAQVPQFVQRAEPQQPLPPAATLAAAPQQQVPQQPVQQPIQQPPVASQQQAPLPAAPQQQAPQQQAPQQQAPQPQAPQPQQITLTGDCWGLPFLAEQPKPPEVEVIFDLGVAGLQRAWFHAVYEQNESLVLVLDTRGTHGEYLPPDTSEVVPSITCTIPSLGKTVVVRAHSRAHVRIGCLTILHLFEVRTSTAVPGPPVASPQILSDIESMSSSFQDEDGVDQLA